MNSQRSNGVELFVLFVFCPLLLGLAVPMWAKLSACAGALLYVGWFAYKLGLFRFKAPAKVASTLMVAIATKFAIFAFLSTIIMWWYAPDKLFYVVINNPKLWIVMSLVYTFLSVIPQEFVYRTFFFKRYQNLFSSHLGFVVISAFIFSFAHFFLHNTLVFILTFCGGLLFNHSYKKHGSLWLVSVEHSAYGLWLFTLGMGDMLAFPGGPSVAGEGVAGTGVAP